MKSLEEVRKRIHALESYAEKACEEMYEARSPAGAGGYFSEVKEVLNRAIGLARENGLEAEAERLGQRLEQIRQVYESQLS